MFAGFNIFHEYCILFVLSDGTFGGYRLSMYLTISQNAQALNVYLLRWEESLFYHIIKF